MTKPTISDDEVNAVELAVGYQLNFRERNLLANALSDFLARRVPDAAARADERDIAENIYRNGFNACRDIVWSGRKG